MIWNNDKIFHLIELYQTKALLWDNTRGDYKDKPKKEAALAEISKALNISQRDVETKLHILRTQFSRETKKITAKKSTGSGEIEKSRWMYYEPLQFLLHGATTSGSDTKEKIVSSVFFYIYFLPNSLHIRGFSKTLTYFKYLRNFFLLFLL